jgi:mRNA interferase MazF
MKRGEIWMADMGSLGKVRPVLVISIPFNEEERTIVSFVPRTTSVWGNGRFDVPHKARGMKDGAFAVQLVGSLPKVKLIRKLGTVSDETLEEVEVALKRWLGFSAF